MACCYHLTHIAGWGDQQKVLRQGMDRPWMPDIVNRVARRPELAVRRGLVIRICDIPHPPMVSGRSRPLPSSVAPERSHVVTASTRIGAWRAAIPGYRLARTPAFVGPRARVQPLHKGRRVERIAP